MSNKDDYSFKVPKAFQGDSGRYYDTGGKRPEEKKYARLLADLAFLAIPGGAIVRGVFKFGKLTGPKAVEAARKAITAAKKTKKPEPGKTTTMPNRPTLKKDRPTLKKDVKFPPKTPPKTPPKKGLTNVEKAAVAVLGATALERATRKKDGVKIVNTKTDAKPKKKVKIVNTKTDAKPKKKTTVVNTKTDAKPKKKATVVNTKTDAKPKKKATVVNTKTGTKTQISAGKNTGFGPKGNRFPSNAEERAALMKMYGGTGSAAAKAAMAGTQGNISAGKKALEAARKKRLSKKGK